MMGLSNIENAARAGRIASYIRNLELKIDRFKENRNSIDFGYRLDPKHSFRYRDGFSCASLSDAARKQIADAIIQDLITQKKKLESELRSL